MMPAGSGGPGMGAPPMPMGAAGAVPLVPAGAGATAQPAAGAATPGGAGGLTQSPSTNRFSLQNKHRGKA